MDYKYSKKDKLKSKKQIEELFTNGQSVMAYPLLIKYNKTQFNDNAILKAGVSVSKRNFKRAVDRIRIKRLLREVYRLNKPHYFKTLSTSHAIMILYIGKEMPEFLSLNKTLKTLLKQLDAKIN